MLTLLVRLASLLYNLITNYRFNDQDLSEYFLIEVPFCMMINAQIVQLYQWLELSVLLNDAYKQR